MAKIADISKKLKDISGGISEKVVDVSGSVKSVMSSYADKYNSIDNDRPVEITTIQQLSKWISSTQPDTNTCVGLLMQAQLQSLNHIETSSLSGMVIDNILVCLYKALEVSGDEHERRLIRESFAALLQSVIFVSEARLQHEIKKNKEDAIQMLTAAGDLITQSVSGAASALVAMSSGVGAVAKCAQALPVFKNVISSKLLDVGSLSYLLSAKKRQEALEERVKDHTQMLKNLFKTFDRYSEMVGPSIQIHGLLSRYAEQLNELYVSEQNEEVVKCTTRFATQMKIIMEEMQISLKDELRNKTAIKGVQKLTEFIRSFKSESKDEGELGYDEMIYIYNFLKERYNSLLDQVARINSDIALKQERHNSLGIFSGAAKMALAAEMSNVSKKADKLTLSLSNIDEKIRIVESIILPVKKNIEEYSAKLNDIVEKYAIC